MSTVADLFTDVIELPNPDALDRYAQLVGLDSIKERLEKRARLLLNPGRLEEWSRRHYGSRIALVDCLSIAAPLFVFAGDVGTGKTVLAETFGDRIAREENIAATLYRLNLSARGSGAVGEMTKLLGAAFGHVRAEATKAPGRNARARAATILLIDEADALAQSRELGQMHHEDRAGVNALIRGIDELAATKAPAVIVMCTNRLDAIDPAVRRRAAEIFVFRRPDFDQRLAVLSSALTDAGLSYEELRTLAELTGAGPDGQPGFTYSDLRQRLLPSIVLDAFPDRAVTFQQARRVAGELAPTPPFQSEVVEAGNERGPSHA